MLCCVDQVDEKNEKNDDVGSKFRIKLAQLERFLAKVCCVVDGTHRSLMGSTCLQVVLVLGIPIKAGRQFARMFVHAAFLGSECMLSFG